MYGPHVAGSLPCHKIADRLATLRAAGDRGQFARVARAGIEKIGPHVDDKTAETIADSMFRCAQYEPVEWRRNVVITLERIRNGWS